MECLYLLLNFNYYKIYNFDGSNYVIMIIGGCNENR